MLSRKKIIAITLVVILLAASMLWWALSGRDSAVSVAGRRYVARQVESGGYYRVEIVDTASEQVVLRSVTHPSAYSRSFTMSDGERFWHYSGDAGEIVFLHENGSWKEYVLEPNLPFLNDKQNELHKAELALPVYEGRVPKEFRSRVGR